jgi:hexosaminidase
MKHYFPILSAFLTFSSVANVQKTTPRYPIIPKPNEIVSVVGNFKLSPNTVIVCPKNDMTEGVYLQKYLQKQYGISLKVSSDYTTKFAKIYFTLTVPDTLTTNEEYKLEVTPKYISINAHSNAGMFYAVQSLIQLMPATKIANLSIPCVKINDEPRYKWRGMHLDCSRHFFTKTEVKKYIDYLALYKFNTFHWHLTDDQGWRIEIKQYPRLTQISSQRKETLVGKPSDKPKYDHKPYGGFYTQADIKEIVAYADERHITIVPEIEMPGHSLAALAAYPQLSCTGGPFETYTTWGVSDDVFCAGNDSTFIFLQNVLSEVMDLFPGKYIHIGGDECTKIRWQNCAKCQKRIAKENLKDVNELQSYFINHIEKYVNSKGRQIIGWDEILEGGLAPNAAVMSWRGTEGGIAAAKDKHYVVMTPSKPCYFDHYQSKDKAKEPMAIGGYNPLDSVYAYNPTPSVLSNKEAKYILGAQGNIWTEHISTFKQVEYMSIPRMCALAEVLWTKPENKNYADFIIRLKNHSAYLNTRKVNYAKHFLKQTIIK